MCNDGLASGSLQRLLLAVFFFCTVIACGSTPESHDPDDDIGVNGIVDDADPDALSAAADADGLQQGDVDPSSSCGNGTCDSDEDCASCPEDCLSQGQVCCAGRSRLPDRFIDFDQGDDDSSGTSRSAPWKHHPWDSNATGNAASDSTAAVYVFKKGVAYRGTLEATHSGTEDDPICLTSAPDWGDGAAALVGSRRLVGPWKRCTSESCPQIPPTSLPATWHADLERNHVPRLLWELDGAAVTRIPIARTPNWTVNYADDPRVDWWELTGCRLERTLGVDTSGGFEPGDQLSANGKVIAEVLTVNGQTLEVVSQSCGSISKGTTITNGATTAVVTSSVSKDIRRLEDSVNLTHADPQHFKGAIMWAEGTSQPKPNADAVLDYDPAAHALRIDYLKNSGFRPGTYDRYFLEGLPQFLDEPGEYYVEKSATEGEGGRLFVRLPGDRDPNGSHVEAAKDLFVLRIYDQSHIVVSGLQLRFSNDLDPRSKSAKHAGRYASLVQIRGGCSDVRITNCGLSHAPAGVVAYPKVKSDRLDFLEVSNSELHDLDGSGVVLSSGRSTPTVTLGARLVHARVFGNQLHNIGARTLTRVGLGVLGAGVQIDGGELVEVADNDISHTWGPAILVFGGAAYFRGKVARPLLRTLIHENVARNTMLGLQDYGGIASWMGGPSYVYNNISHNAVGYKHAQSKKNTNVYYRRGTYGVGIYLDGQYKGYVFNNIVSGKNNDAADAIYNSAAFNEAMGFMNTVFHNTLYRHSVGLHKGMVQHNRCRYLGNLLIDMGQMFIRQDAQPKVIEHHSLAFDHNVFSGAPTRFGKLGSSVFDTLQDWQQGLASTEAMTDNTGQLATAAEQVVDAPAYDFRPLPGSQVIDGGVKVFVPWGLYGVVGEWNFLLHPAEPARILGENMYMNDEWLHRGMYQDIPRNDLICHNVDASAFGDALLEDWTKGSLQLNGTDQFCELPDATLKEDYDWSILTGDDWSTTTTGMSGTYPGSSRETVDMDDNNFLVEVVFRTQPGHTGGTLVSKQQQQQQQTGYLLDIDTAGRARLTLLFGVASSCYRSSAAIVNDGKWHHLIAEVDRAAPLGITLYVDGKRSDGAWSGTMDHSASLSNSADFLVGAKSKDAGMFAGALDFLRVSRGTLEQAETSIDELYSWQFDGPFLRDFDGRAAQGRRDVGALELQ